MDELINDIITITIDDQSLLERAKDMDLLVIHTRFMPLQSSEALKQDDALSLHKLAGEFWLAKHKTCMGWYIQKR